MKPAASMDDPKYDLPEQLILARQADLLRTFYKFTAGLTFIALVLIAFVPGYATQENVLEPFVRNVFVALSIGVLYWLVEKNYVVEAIFGTIAISSFIATYSIYQESPGNMQMMMLIVFPVCVAGLLPRRSQFWLVFVLNFVLMLVTFWLIIVNRGVEVEPRSIVTVGILMTLIALLIDVLSSSYRNSLTVTFNQLTELQQTREQLVKLDEDLEAAVSDKKAAEHRRDEMAQSGRPAMEIAGASAVDINTAIGEVAISETFIKDCGLASHPQTLDQLCGCLHPSERDRFKTLIGRSQNSRSGLQGDFRIDTERPAYWMFALETINQGQLRGVVVDVTHRVLEQQRSVTEESLQHESLRHESLRLLAGSVAHDFNNRLHVITLNADLARHGLEPDSKTAASIERVITSASRAAELCNELLAYSGRGLIEAETFDMNHLVSEVKNLQKTSTPEAVAVNIDSDGSNPSIQADIAKIRQALVHLITNAGEAIGNRSDGQINIVIGTQSVDAITIRERGFIEEVTPGEYLSICVEDNGGGLDNETRWRMFDPFFTTRDSGHGLGLSAVLGIVRGHSGTIQVDSDGESGTRISILLPLQEAEVTVAVPQTAGTVTHGKEKMILFADDAPEIRELAKTVLEDTGYRIVEAEDGEQAIDVFKQHHEELHLVILDLMMPKKTGLEAYFEISEIDASVPVVFSSGFTESDLMQQLPAKTRAVFLKKPYLANDLKQFVEGLIGERR